MILVLDWWASKAHGARGRGGSEEHTGIEHRQPQQHQLYEQHQQSKQPKYREQHQQSKQPKYREQHQQSEQPKYKDLKVFFDH